MKNPLKNLFTARRLNVTNSAYIGVKEIVGIVALVALFSFAAYSRIEKLGPIHGNVMASQTEYAKLQSEADKLRASQRQRERQAELLKTAIEKKEDFEQAYLRTDIRTGQFALIDNINEFTRKHTVQLDGGIEFPQAEIELPLLPGETQKAGTPEKDKPKTIFYPALTARFRVVGNYNNVRKFIQTLEQTKQFLVVRLSEIQSTKETSGQSGMNVSSSGTDTITVGIEVTLFARPESES